MTDQRPAFSDEDLTAFLDQEAPDALARAIETALAQDDGAVADRLAALDIPKAAMAAEFDAFLTQAPAMPPLPAPIPQMPQPVAANMPDAPRWGGFGWGAGSGLVAGLAAAVTFFLMQPQADAPTRGWVGVVASYQMLYTPETLAAEADSPDASTLASLSDVVGLDLTRLEQIEGLEFRRAQQLGFNGKPLIQLAYTLPDGTPFAICILQSGKDKSGPRFQELEGLQAADWTTGDHGVLLIGGQNADVLNRLAPQVDALL